MRKDQGDHSPGLFACGDTAWKPGSWEEFDDLGEGDDKNAMPTLEKLYNLLMGRREQQEVERKDTPTI